MSILQKILLKLKIESKFLFEQKWGIKEPSDPFSIPKYLSKKYLPRNPIIVDCGAYDGADTIELVKILNAQAHAFEAVPEIFERLKKKTAAFPNIRCYNLALSNKNGVQTFYISEGASDASSSLLEPKDHLIDHPSTRFNKRIQVEALTLDEWANRNKISKVDMLWLDMQGFEYQVLRASPNIFSKVSVIHAEISMRETYSDVLLYREFMDWMSENSFEVVKEAIPQDADMGNVLFVRKK
jgi:FkbM family methyltransferase